MHAFHTKQASGLFISLPSLPLQPYTLHQFQILFCQSARLRLEILTQTNMGPDVFFLAGIQESLPLEVLSRKHRINQNKKKKNRGDLSRLERNRETNRFVCCLRSKKNISSGAKLDTHVLSDETQRM